MYNVVMTTRGFKVPLSEEGKEIPGYIIGFTGDDLVKLEKLKKKLELDEEQDVVRIALFMLERMMKAEKHTKKHGHSDNG